MTTGFRLALIWMLGSVLAVVMAFNYLPVSFVDGHYVPAGDDAFYHARRILDTVEAPARFYEFDNRIHYPEGSWIPWPWGYDYLTARVVRAYVQLTGARDPMAVLAYVPVAAVTLSILLILGIGRAIRLSLPACLLAVIWTALSPLTLGLHGVGAIDHHFAEYIFVLAALLAGIHLMREPARLSLAIGLGALGGFAVAFHNGLFILQLPLIITAGISWLRRNPLPRSTAIGYGVSLIVTTLLAVAPSAALWRGEFQFYLLSWFHVWISVCSASIVVTFSTIEVNRRGAVLLTVLTLLLLLPIASQLSFGLGFVSADLTALKGIDETQGLFALAGTPQGVLRITQQYGYIGWLAPVWLLIALVGIVKARQRSLVYFFVTSALGLGLLLLQLRFHYFGSFAICLLPFLLLERLAERSKRAKWVIYGLTPIALGIAMFPSLQVAFLTHAPVGLSTRYDMTRAVYPVLREACDRNPGVVLASWDDGHYVRYHSECSVIADNFMLTPQHVRKYKEVERLLSLTPEALLRTAPQVRYVFARLNLIYSLDSLGRASIVWGPEVLGVNKQLVNDLVLGDPSQLPAAYRPLFTVWLSQEKRIPAAILYEIVPVAREPQ